MNWEAIGSIGEIIGAIAVIATLIYLAKQIRQQNKIATINNWNSIIDGFKELTVLNTNGELASIALRGATDPEALNDVEAMQLQFLLRTYLVLMLKAWRGYEMGYLPKNQWHEWANEFAANLETPGGILFRQNSVGSYGSEFWDAIDKERLAEKQKPDYTLGREAKNQNTGHE